MRISLARLLLDRPSLLILDEPTNHLDLEATRWLESFLAGYPRAFIVVSHDRYFLDRIAQEIWELHGGRLYRYKGNYSQYLPQRAAPGPAGGKPGAAAGGKGAHGGFHPEV